MQNQMLPHKNICISQRASDCQRVDCKHYVSKTRQLGW